MRRQVFATFQDDPTGLASPDAFGASNAMWASDYPHVDSTWPRSRETIARTFAGIPDDVAARVLHGNATRLYGA